MKKLLLLLSLVFCTMVLATEPGYHVIKKLSLGGEGFWD